MVNAVTRDDAVRVGVLGCGRIGRFHAELLAGRVPGVTLAAIYDPLPQVTAELGHRLRVPVMGSAGELLASTGIDAVAICTSTDTHVDLLVAAAEAGKAILCEKPVSLNLEEVDRALAAVDKAGVVLQIGFNRRFDPGHRSVRDAVARGDVGDLHLVRISSRDPAPPPLAYVKTSGGIFLDLTIHELLADLPGAVGTPAVDLDLLRYLRARSPAFRDQEFEIRAHAGNRQSTQPIVAAQLDDDDARPVRGERAATTSGSSTTSGA